MNGSAEAPDSTTMVIDLSHPVSPEMPVWPGTPPPECLPVASLGVEGFVEHSIRFSSHTGTHIDAPAHMIDGGETLDRYPAERFFGSAAVVDLCDLPGGVIGTSLLEGFRATIAAAGFLLLRTGWDRFWGTEAYDAGYPVLDDDAAEWLCGMGLKGIGIDAPSFDRAGSETWPLHHRLLGSGLLLIENLSNLHLLPPAGANLAVFPLAIRGVDAFPVRAVALL